MEALEMERPITEWNDDRLDELNGRVKDGFAQVDERFIRLEGEMKEGFAKVDERFDKERFARREEMSEVRADLRHLGQRFDRLYYLILVTVVGLAGSLLANSVWG
jgi:glutathionyl-hydroquinone reductase